MKLDFAGAFAEVMTERTLINDRLAPVYCNVQTAGDPVSGGAQLARQNGDQYTLRFNKLDYPEPEVHDVIKTTNFGTLRMKQRYYEGDLWACLCTGEVSGRRSI